MALAATCSTQDSAAAETKWQLDQLFGQRRRWRLAGALALVLGRAAAVESAVSFGVGASGSRISASIALVHTSWRRPILPSSVGACAPQRLPLCTLGHRILAYSASCARNGAARATALPVRRAQSVDQWNVAVWWSFREKNRNLKMSAVCECVVGWTCLRYHRPCIELLSRMVCGRTRDSDAFTWPIFPVAPVTPGAHDERR